MVLLDNVHIYIYNITHSDSVNSMFQHPVVAAAGHSPAGKGSKPIISSA